MGGLQESVEAMTEVSQETTASAEQRKIDTAKEKLRKTEEAKLKREQEVQAARAKRIEKIKAEGGYIVHSDDELRRYRRYPRIYGERLFQKPVVSERILIIYSITDQPEGQVPVCRLPGATSRDPLTDL
jgi:predicted transcriptional regulator